MAAVVKPVAPELLLPRFKPGNPVSLTGSVDLNPGSTLPLNIDALRNPSKLPLAIREIKLVSTTGVVVARVNFSVSSASGSAPPTSSAVMEVNISLDKHLITRSPIPANLLAVRRSSAVEVIQSGGPAGSSIFGLTNQVWRLDHALILRGGQALSISVGHRGFYPYPITARATISGIFLPSMPRSMHVPYVAAFVPAAFLPDTGTSDSRVRTSTERDLVNELTVPLRVRRFIGRVSATAGNNEALWDVIGTANSLLTTVSMRSSAGTPTVRNDTPFESVFDAPTAAWECPHILPPNAYWIATLKSAATLAAGGAQIMPGIALHGTREVRT